MTNQQRRLQFHNILIDLLGTRDLAESRVYFQPPETVKMHYPAIVYKRDTMSIDYSDDKLYTRIVGYMVTVIDPDPDSNIYVKILENLPMSRFSRHYAASNLNHDVLNVYY